MDQGKYPRQRADGGEPTTTLGQDRVRRVSRPAPDCAVDPWSAQDTCEEPEGGAETSGTL